MKELVYNNPDFCKQRAESKPLSEPRLESLIQNINSLIPKALPKTREAMQMFIWEFENLRHFKAVHEGKSCNNCEVNYEIVKGY
jgi:hypothetical protein